MLRNTESEMGHKAMKRLAISMRTFATLVLVILALGSCSADKERVVVAAPPSTAPSTGPGVTNETMSSSPTVPPVQTTIEVKRLQNKNRKASALGQLCWALQEANIVGGEVGLEALRTLPPQANGAKPVLPGLPGAAVAAKFRPLAAEIRKIDLSSLPDGVADYGRFFAGQVDTLIGKSLERNAVSQVDIFAEFFNYDSYPNRAIAEDAMRRSPDCDFT
jgi:hypothetical protein